MRIYHLHSHLRTFPDDNQNYKCYDKYLFKVYIIETIILWQELSF